MLNDPDSMVYYWPIVRIESKWDTIWISSPVDTGILVSVIDSAGYWHWVVSVDTAGNVSPKSNWVYK